MFIARELREGFSKFWLTPDLRMGVHYLQYFTEDYYCLPHMHPEYNVAGDVTVLNPGEVHQSRYGLKDAPGEAVGLIVHKSELESILQRKCSFHLATKPSASRSQAKLTTRRWFV